eukprot:724567-Lingulodinium_polyedra.AAC.1
MRPRPPSPPTGRESAANTGRPRRPPRGTCRPSGCAPSCPWRGARPGHSCASCSGNERAQR